MALKMMFEINLGGEWQALGEEERAFLEHLVRKGDTSGELQSRGHRYRFDLAALTQTNLSSGKIRKIRRLEPPEGPKQPLDRNEPASPREDTAAASAGLVVEVWLAGEWKKLSAEECKEIARQRELGARVFSCTSKRGGARAYTYNIDLGQMTQTNTESGRTRTIRIMDARARASSDIAASGFDGFRDGFRILCGGGSMKEKTLIDSWEEEATGPLWQLTAKEIMNEMDLRGNQIVDMTEWNHYWALERDSPSFHAGREVNEKIREALKADPQVLGRMQMHFETALGEQDRGTVDGGGLSSQGLVRVCERLVNTPKDVLEKRWAAEVLAQHRAGDGLEDDVELSYYDFLNVMLGRKKFKIYLYMYDISDGVAERWSWLLLGQTVEGIWHTGVVIEWPEEVLEFWFGGALFQSKPGTTPFGQPLMRSHIGYTYKLREEVWEYMSRHCAREFTRENYDVLTHNCNHFSDKLSMYLQNQHIPDEVRFQPDRLMNTLLAQALRPLLNQWLGGFDQAKLGGLATDAAKMEALWEAVLPGALVQFSREEGGRPLVGEVTKSTAAMCSVRQLDFLSQRAVDHDVERPLVIGVLQPAPPGGRRIDDAAASSSAARGASAWWPSCTAPASSRVGTGGSGGGYLPREPPVVPGPGGR